MHYIKCFLNTESVIIVIANKIIYDQCEPISKIFPHHVSTSIYVYVYWRKGSGDHVNSHHRIMHQGQAIMHHDSA